ncbi:MAG TPA: cytochrome c maturation protein CcmE [Candidatus Dormibacteraeota bacterium]|jgi:cytochrome c-type biogenesis protein CcmE|nr:cytochrome c maturation protein CcmE [Candidatus Dormibacteraeota bacterium]
MIKVVLLALVVAVGVGYFMVSSMHGSADYYQTIQQMRAHPPTTSQASVEGVVQKGVQRGDGGFDVRFVMADGKDRMPVSYQGTLPEIFRPGVQVVVQGKVDQDGTFHATQLQAKCPSHFSAEPAQSH